MWDRIEFLRDNWEAETYPSPYDLRYIFAFAVVFPAIRWILDSFIFEKIGRYFIFKKARQIALQGEKLQEAAAAEAAASDLKTPLLSKANGGDASRGSEGDNAGRQAASAAKGKGRDASKAASSAGAKAAAKAAAVNSVEEIDKAALEKTHIKFKESCWKFLYYFSAELFSVMVTLGEPWLSDTIYFWKGPGNQVWPDVMIKLKLKTLYMYTGGFYTYSIFALIFWETRRKDFVVSMTHHVATVALIVGSYLFRFSRVCSIVVALHDASDVFLELAKLNKYLNIEIMASVAFLLFAISWLWLRLWLFPRYVIYSASVTVLKVLNKVDHPIDGPVLYYIFNFLLILLLVLHVYWWILILRVLLKQIGTRGRVEGDVRSEDEDEDDD